MAYLGENLEDRCDFQSLISLLNILILFIFIRVQRKEKIFCYF